MEDPFMHLKYKENNHMEIFYSVILSFQKLDFSKGGLPTHPAPGLPLCITGGFANCLQL